jgi:hypothetical protein
VHASPFDFVSVLSAEECCPVCSELHASVDQCECRACGSKVCPDCASLRPDTSWICAPCAERFPSLAVPPSAPLVWLRVYLALAGVGAARGRAVLAGALQTVRLRAAAASAVLQVFVRRQHRLQRARLRHLVGSFAIALRNMHFRQHASSLLIATAILIAVARTQTSGDGR